MANAQQAPAGTGVASFRVPRSWETNVPKFTTEDKDDLRDFIEQVDDIIDLGQITDEQEKKRLLTGYLPAKKREIWRGLAEYASNKTYAEFKKAVEDTYPEIKEDNEGTLNELEKLCAENRNIRRGEEGRLKRFGICFRALVQKLTKAPAIILNKEACRRYLDSLERGFAESLRMAINTRNLLKEDLIQAGVQPAPAAGALDHRKEDPILLEDLIKMAERLANKGSSDTTWGEEEQPEIKRSDRFPMIKVEHRDARIDELGSELSGLRDAFLVSQKQSKAAHDELLKAVQGSRSSGTARDESEQPNPRVGMGNSYVGERQLNRGFGVSIQRNQGGCFYCEKPDHFSRECTVKAEHIHKGWLVVEDGQQRLADGNLVPRGRGSAASRVEEYWQKKSAVGQHMNVEAFYSGSTEDEFDALRDEIRTLRVKLNQVATAGNPTNGLVPMSTPVSSYSNMATPQPVINMEELGRTVFNMVKMGGGTQDQFVLQTRSQKRAAASANQPEEDF